MTTITQESAIIRLQEMLQETASAEKKEWWERYLRNIIPFRGVGIPDIRAQIACWRAETGIEGWSNEDQLAIALRLFEYPFAEDKLAGILFLQDYLYQQFDWKLLLDDYASLFTKRLIFDWNTCDWFCVRVLGPTISQHSMACAKAISDWHSADYLWQARSSVVAFVPVASDPTYHPLIYESCEALIKREERFAKTAVGWILRDLSKHDEAGVMAFVETNRESFSAEALKNALKYSRTAK